LRAGSKRKFVFDIARFIFAVFGPDAASTIENIPSLRRKRHYRNLQPQRMGDKRRIVALQSIFHINTDSFITAEILGRIDPAGPRDRKARRPHHKPRQIVLLDAMGGGFTWGAAVVRW
jgi:hypothetical protein